MGLMPDVTSVLVTKFLIGDRHISTPTKFQYYRSYPLKARTVLQALISRSLFPIPCSLKP
jgi:hypothetical protein